MFVVDVMVMVEVVTLGLEADVVGDVDEVFDVVVEVVDEVLLVDVVGAVLGFVDVEDEMVEAVVDEVLVDEVLLDVNELDEEVVEGFVDVDELELDCEVVVVELVVAFDVDVDVEVEVLEDVMLVEVTGAGQAPVIDGTASTPDPIGTRFVPQLAEFARRRFRLS